MLFDDGLSEGLFSTAKTPKSLSYHLTSALFSVHYQHSPHIQRIKHHSPIRYVLCVSLSILQTLQIVGVLLSFNSDLEDYSDAGVTILRVLSPGVWAEYGNEDWALGVSVSLVGTMMGSFALEIGYAVVKGEQEIPKGLRLVSSCSFTLLHRVFLYSFFPLWFHYLLIPHTLYQSLLSLFSLLFTTLTLSLRLLFIGDNNWYLRKDHLFSKSSSEFEIREVLTSFTLSFIFSFFTDKLLIYGIISSLILTLQMTYFISTSLPYLNKLTLYTRTVQFTVVTWMSICVLMGRISNTIRTTLYLFLFVSPGICLLSVYFLRKKIKLWRECEDCKDFQGFEIAVRKLLADFEENKVNAVEVKNAILRGCRRFSYDKRAYLLFAQYYYYIREEAEYALLRLSCANACHSTLIRDFQVYHFFLRVCESIPSDERNYLDYVSFYRQAMQSDLQLCQSMFNFTGTLLLPGKSNLQKMKEQVTLLAIAVRQTHAIYQQGRNRYPADSVLRILYKSLQKDIFFGKTEEIVLKTTPRSDRSLSDLAAGYSSIGTGVFIISCSKGKFGKIVFANQKCAEILETTVDDIEGHDLDDFLPPPFFTHHNQIMENFIKAGEAREIFRTHLFLYAHTKYSVEVTFRFRPTGYRGVPYFVVAIRSKPHTREFALYDFEMNITSHSKKFPSTLNVDATPKGTLNGKNLRDLLPGIDTKMRNHGEGRSILYSHPTTKEHYYLLFASTGLGSRTVRWVYIYHSESNVRDLVNPAIHRSFTNKSPSVHHETSYDSVSTSFSMSLKGLRLKRQIHTAEKQMKIAFAVGGIMAILLSLISFIFVHSLLDVIINEHSDRDDRVFLAPYRVAEIVYLTRKIELISSGFDTKSSIDAALIDLDTHITGLELIANENFMSDRETVLVWSRLNHGFFHQKLGIGSAISDFLTHAHAFVEENESFNDDLYFIYRNGLGELMDKLLKMNAPNGRVEEEEGQLLIIHVMIGTFLGCSVSLILTLMVVLRNGLRFRRIHHYFWRLLTRIDASLLTQLILPHQERLVQIHGLSIPILKSTPRRHISIPPFTCFHLISICVLYVLLCSSIYLVAGLYGYSEMKVVFTNGLDSMHHTSEMMSQPLLALEYTKEFALDSIQKGYFAHINQAQSIVSLAKKATFATYTLKENINTALNLLRNINRLELISPYVDNNCALVLNIPNCEKKPFIFGLETTISEFSMSISMILEKINTNSTDFFEEISTVEESIESFTAILREFHSICIAAAVTEIVIFQRNILICFGGYCGVCMCFYVLICRVYVRKKARECMDMWTVMQLVRSDYVKN